MNKSFIVLVIFVLLFCFLINGFIDSYASNDISNLAYLLALGIDVGENAEIKLTAQFSKTAIFASGGASSSEDKDNIVLISGEADCIFNGLNLLNSYIGKEINLAHCSLIVFSEEIAKQGIFKEISTLINDEEIRPSVNVLVSKCSAYDYLSNIKPNLEKLVVQYYDTFSISNRFTGYFPNSTIGNFYNNMYSKNYDPVAILGGLDVDSREDSSKGESSSNSSSGSEKSDSKSKSSGSSSDSKDNGSNSEESESKKDSSNSNEKGSKNDSSSKDSESTSQDKEPSNVVTNPETLTAGSSSIKGENGTENIGIAVFKDDKMCGELTVTETICHLILNNNLDSFIALVDNPLDTSKKISFNISPTKKPKITVDIKDDVPHIYVSVFLTADIVTLEKDVDYSSQEVLDKLSDTSSKYLKEQFENYFNKISKEFGTDIDHIASFALSRFTTEKGWTDFNWKEKFKNAEFNVDISVKVTSSLLVTKTTR